MDGSAIVSLYDTHIFSFLWTAFSKWFEIIWQCIFKPLAISWLFMRQSCSISAIFRRLVSHYEKQPSHRIVQKYTDETILGMFFLVTFLTTDSIIFIGLGNTYVVIVKNRKIERTSFRGCFTYLQGLNKDTAVILGHLLLPSLSFRTPPTCLMLFGICDFKAT